MSLFDEMAADVAEVFAAYGDEIEFRGVTLRALVSEPDTLTEPVPGGFGEDCDLTVKLMRNDIAGGPPKHGEAVRYGARDYRIVRVMDRPGRPLIVLTVEPANG